MIPGMEEVVRRVDHLGEDNTLLYPLKEVEWAPTGGWGGHCRRGHWLGGTMVSDGLEEPYGS